MREEIDRSRAELLLPRASLLASSNGVSIRLVGLNGWEDTFRRVHWIGVIWGRLHPSSKSCRGPGICCLSSCSAERVSRGAGGPHDVRLGPSGRLDPARWTAGDLIDG